MRTGNVLSLTEPAWNAGEPIPAHSRRLRSLASQILPPQAIAMPPSAEEIVRRRLLLEMMNYESLGPSKEIEGVALFGLAEIDGAGNVAACSPGEAAAGGASRIVGAEAFADAVRAAKAIVVAGTLTADGLQIDTDEDSLRIRMEGRTKRIVSRVSRPSFNARHIESLGIPVRCITERAVFAMRDGRLVLTEIAAGMDLEHDLLDQCMAPITVAPNLRLMESRIFRCGPDWLLGDASQREAGVGELMSRIAALP